MARTKTPLNQPSLNTIETFPILDLEDYEDKGQNIIKGKAVIIIDPQSGKIIGTTNPLPVGVSTTVPIPIEVYNYGGAGAELVRTPSKYANVAIAAAPATTDVFTPTAGKKFRLLGGIISMSGMIAAAATRTLELQQETLGSCGLPLISVTIPVLGFNLSVPFTIPGNGYLSTVASKKLQVVTTGGTYTTGGDSVTVFVTEE